MPTHEQFACRAIAQTKTGGLSPDSREAYLESWFEGMDAAISCLQNHLETFYKGNTTICADACRDRAVTHEVFGEGCIQCLQVYAPDCNLHNVMQCKDCLDEHDYPLFPTLDTEQERREFLDKCFDIQDAGWLKPRDRNVLVAMMVLVLVTIVAALCLFLWQ